MAPVNTLFKPNVIEAPDAVPENEEAPGTVNIPDCVIAPKVVTDSAPLFVRVIAGRSIAALLNLKVKLRKLVKPEKLGDTAPKLLFLMLTSRILVTVPPNNNGKEPKLLEVWLRIMSVLAVVKLTVMKPPDALSAPV